MPDPSAYNGWRRAYSRLRPLAKPVDRCGRRPVSLPSTASRQAAPDGGAGGMPKWSKKSLRMDEDHTWRARPDHKIFVADRGAVRFDIPADWVVVTDEKGLRLHDRQPPDDSCVLELTVFYLPPGIDWDDLPLATMLAQAVDARGADLLGRTPVAHVLRSGLEIVWTETRAIDPGEQREARSRHLLARAANIQAFISLAFWPDDAQRLEPVWDEVIRSLRVGEFVDEPLRGPRRPPRR